MDTMKTTVTEDALGKDVKHTASASTCEMNSAKKPDEKTSFNTEKETKADREESDDLLEKIEEVVNDKINSEIMDNDISQSSEHDFIKKIEEIENEVEEAKGEKGPSKEKENKDECDSDQIIVGKLVMEVSSDDKKEKVGTTESNGEGSNDLVSSVSENVILPEANKGVEADLEKIVDSTSEHVGEANESSEKSTCDETKENGKKNDADVGEAKNENVLPLEDVKSPNEKASSNACSEVPDTTSDKEPIPSKSKESAVTTSAEEVSTGKTSPKSSDKVSESIKTSTELSENRSSLKTTTVPSADEESTAKPTQTLTKTKPLTEATEKSKTLAEDVCKGTVSESEKKDEPMVIDLCDPLDEPMDVDSEEKMDVDAISDDICEENDEEMKSAEEIVQSEQKTKKEGQGKTTKSPDVAETSKSDEDKQISESKVADPKTVQPEPDSQVTENPKEGKKLVEVKKSRKSDTADQLEKISETNKSKNKSPTVSENVADNPVSKTKISAAATSQPKSGHDKKVVAVVPKTKISPAATSQPKSGHDKKVEATVSQSPQKQTTQAEAKKEAGDLTSTKENVKEKKIEPEKKVPEEKSDSYLKSKPTPEKKDRAGDCPVKSTLPVIKVSESAEADSTEGKDNFDKKEIGKKEVESVVPQEKKVQEKGKESKDIKMDEDKKVKKSKKENEQIQNEISKQKEVQIEEAPDQSKSTSTSVENEIGSEVKEHRSSDSTASLSSTTDEHIIKFGMETTLPGEEPEQPAKKIENKPLMNMIKHGCSTPSLNTTPVTTPNVFNSTPIEKQFEISSENVSKISETNETSRTEKTVEEDANLNKSSKPEYSSESGTTYTSKYTKMPKLLYI